MAWGDCWLASIEVLQLTNILIILILVYHKIPHHLAYEGLRYLGLPAKRKTGAVMEHQLPFACSCVFVCMRVRVRVRACVCMCVKSSLMDLRMRCRVDCRAPCKKKGNN